ncbi:MAG: glycerate kinase [Cyanobacteria bacterium J06638_22]
MTTSILQAVLDGTIAPADAIAQLSSEISAFDQSPLAQQQRLERLQECHPRLQVFCRETLGWSAVNLETLWRLWLPLAEQIADLRNVCNRPIVQGFLGGQGTGKTTLTQILSCLLEQWGYGVAILSVDDIYKTYGDRQQLQHVDPRLRWRGPPGTHDISTGIQVLQQVRSGSADPVLMPRFDKSLHGGMGDRIAPEPASNIDILLFEGWFVGMRPLDAAQFDTAPWPISSEDDRVFARDCNHRLQDYLPLWDLLDALVVLRPGDYRLSKQWRQEAEQKMKQQGRSGMSDAEIAAFVEYFWTALHPELFLPPLLKSADLVIEVQPDHRPGRVQRPESAIAD